MRYSEKWGDSIDSAVDLALADLGLSKEQVTVTVLEQPSKGFFGIGSRLAKVRVEEISPAKSQAPAAEAKQSKQPEKQVKKEDGLEIVIEKCGVEGESERSARPKKKKSRKPERKARESAVEDSYLFDEIKVLGERPDDLVEQEEHEAKRFLQEVAKEMGLIVNVKVSCNKDSVYVDIDGEDSGTIIGKRGTTLDALQYLTSLVLNKDQEDYIRVVIDAEGYRQKREKTLEKLAFRLADKAARSGRSVRLEPMNPYERKVIHMALQQRRGVSTRSEGDEPYRRVVIEPVK